MVVTLTYIALALLAVFLLFLAAGTVKDNIEREKERRENIASQFSGSPVKERTGFLDMLFSGRNDSMAEQIGRDGEMMVSSLLGDLNRNEYWVYNDILLCDGDHTTQIDHLVISRFGVFVIETKNIHGKIYGGSNSEFWKQYLPDTGYKRNRFTQEHQLRNPLWQNNGHIKALRKLVFGNDVPIHGIVVFPMNTELNISSDEPVLGMLEVVPYIEEFMSYIISEEQMASYHEKLMGVISTSESKREQHLVNISQNKEHRNVSVASGKCPRCGGELVLRSGLYGRFYGCSNYPACKYVLS